MEGFVGFNSSGEEALPSVGNEHLEFAFSEEQEIHRGGASSSSGRVQYTRHTPHQTEELESLFKKNHHPTEKQRTEIARKLNIKENKVKFWFQNRRTQQKAQTERHENAKLKEENDRLKLELLAMQEAAKNSICNKCGAQATVPDSSIQQHKLLIEVARLKDKLSTMTTNTSTTGDQVLAEGSYTTSNPMETQSQMGIDIHMIQRNGYLEQALGAMGELLRLGLVNAPLWIRNKEGGGETLNFAEYARDFPPFLGKKPLGFVSEATRASSVVPMSSSTIVEALLNADKWREMFTGIIGSCTTTEVVSNGTGGSRNGALQLMKAEIQLISPLVPVRTLKFIRFTKQQAEGLWIVVDLSNYYGTEGQQLTRRCPSGCILHDMPNGLSKVTWIEHVEYDEQSVPQQYRQLISSGLGFGAQRWISALLRHCEGIRAIISPTLNTHLFQDTKTSLKSLAQRMTSIFCAGVCLTGEQQWTLVSNAPGGPRIMARNSITGFGEPSGLITSATYSVWIPTNHQHLFDLLLKKDLRCLWDVICHDIATCIMTDFHLGQDESGHNCISILNSNDECAEDNDEIMVLQETSSDMTGSLIVYATVDFKTVNVVMNGEDTSSVALLPSGICIVPGYGSSGERGSMVTVGYQVLQDTSDHLTMETISTIKDLVSRTVLGIKEIVRSSQHRA